MSKKLVFAVIGCGRFGSLRAKKLNENKDVNLKYVVDINKEKAEKLAQELKCEYFTDYRDVIIKDDVDCILVATPNKFHAPITIASLKNKKHVLCEKPLARNTIEAKKMVDTASENGVFLKVGSNHRYFPNVQKAKELIDKNAIGKLLFLRGWIGHEGERLKGSWFWDKEISGGGTLLDNGCHLLDISRWFLGEFDECMGYTGTTRLSIKPLEDNAFGFFKTIDGKIAFIQSSWTEWSGYMYFEVYGTEGYIFVDNRFCNKTIYGQKNGKSQVFDFSLQPPQSYDLEIKDFINAIKENRQPLPSGFDGLRVIQMVHAVYESAKKGSKIKIQFL